MNHLFHQSLIHYNYSVTRILKQLIYLKICDQVQNIQS